MAGTQAAQTHVNNVIVMKLSNLQKTKNTESDDEDEELSDDEDEVSHPKMAGAMIKHLGCVNRIRVTIFIS